MISLVCVRSGQRWYISFTDFCIVDPYTCYWWLTLIKLRWNVILHSTTYCVRDAQVYCSLNKMIMLQWLWFNANIVLEWWKIRNVMNMARCSDTSGRRGQVRGLSLGKERTSICPLCDITLHGRLCISLGRKRKRCLNPNMYLK